MSSQLQLGDSFVLWRYWLYKAVLNFKLQYRGTRLGILWPILTVLAVVLAIGTLWGILLEKESFADYYFYLLAGYPIWMVISGAVQQGSSSIKRSSAGGIPFYATVLEGLALTMIPFLVVLPLTIVVAFFMNAVTLEFALFLPLTFLCLILWCVGVIGLLMSLVSYVPDLRHFIKAIMRLAFLVTPIIWEVEKLGIYQKYIWFNPFYLPLDVSRQALMGDVDHTMFSYFAIYTLASLLIGSLCLNYRIKQLIK